MGRANTYYSTLKVSKGDERRGRKAGAKDKSYVLFNRFPECPLLPTFTDSGTSTSHRDQNRVRTISSSRREEKGNFLLGRC